MIKKMFTPQNGMRIIPIFNHTPRELIIHNDVRPELCNQLSSLKYLLDRTKVPSDFFSFIEQGNQYYLDAINGSVRFFL
jgi:hypothetical protein